MKGVNALIAAASILAMVGDFANARAATEPLPFEKLAAQCAPDVHPTTLKGVVSTESSWNPYAIGVVGGRLARQPRSLAEAVAAVRTLERQGFNFSMGLGQVNRHNLEKYGETYETVFDPCRNLRAGGAILKDCYLRAKAKISDEQQALRAAFSCYYSGNFTRGFRPDKAGQPSYVQKVVANATSTTPPTPIVPAVQPDNRGDIVTVQPAGRSAKPIKKTLPATRWVIFTTETKPGAMSPIPLNSGPAIDASTQPPNEKQTRSIQRARAAGQQDTSFVQFVN